MNIRKLSKKGDASLFNLIIFIVLNAVFIFVMFMFLDYAGSRALIYEHSYAKQIALLIDNAKPEMVISLNVEKGLEVAKKNKGDLSNVFFLKNGKVFVDLGQGGGYGYEYFTDYEVSFKLSGDILYVGVREGLGKVAINEPVAGGFENV